jgi:opacity protein-like surface antigen
MKKLAALAAFAVVLSAGAAFADTIQNGYGNTFAVTLGSDTVRYHFNEDGTFGAIAPDGSVQHGRYEATDTQICFLGEGDARQCAPLESGKNVGDTWQQLDANGNQITVTLEAGREHGGHNHAH